MKLFNKRRLVIWICIVTVGSLWVIIYGNGLFESKSLSHKNRIPHGLNENKHASRSSMETLESSQELLVVDNFTLKTPNDSMLNAHFLDDLPCEMGFQQEYEIDFPTENTASPKIPHVIHQIWITTSANLSTSSQQMVPVQFIDNMKTFRKFNPSWEYMFWSFANGRSLIERFYPTLLDVFDKAPKSVTKSDLLRYVVVHKYGGLYADLDSTCHRSLDRVTMKYSCILVPAPFENAVFMVNWPYHICNGIFFCRPHHDFFGFLIEKISEISTLSPIPTFSLGPRFFTTIYRQYQNISGEDMYKVNVRANFISPYFYRGHISELLSNGIYIPNTRFFLDQPHPFLKKRLAKDCKNNTNNRLLLQRVCCVFQLRGFERPPGRYTFISHAYSYSFAGFNKNKYTNCVPVIDVMD
ncbi:uncharacterized protein LOC128205412 [Mya arenaria]|uniref:uncharacterized protein LOC128205412 n=1 Tax=Mya arenaria TaxID=6604 RepID=UPI0022DEA771|nr:uncharacterized protein LOC128205412 [Mya arenaria]